MLSSFKSKAPEKDKNAPANVAEVMGRTVQPQDPVVEPATARPDPTTKAGTASRIGSGMSIDGNSLFEGSSRRVENPTEPSSSVDAKGPQKKDMQSSALAPYLQRAEGSASTEWSESTVAPTH